MNLVFVSHCDFEGNSAMHLFSIANVLHDMGHACAISVPSRPETAFKHGDPLFQVLDYETAATCGVSFPNEQPPDLVHAWTPRELVRETTDALVARYRIPYFVHLEDNETIVLLDELPGWHPNLFERVPARILDAFVVSHRSHPRRARRFIDGAAGVSVLIDRLLEFKPPDKPGLVFFPGFDSTFLQIDERNEARRASLGISPDDLVMVYTGNVHKSNHSEISSLLLAVALINRWGCPSKLIKTGTSDYQLPEFLNPEIMSHVIDLGFIAREEIPELLAAADVLVQPGQANDFNDYRFPSKLPEFLASGRPVILPRSNIGRYLKNNEEAVVLEIGNAQDIAQALEHLAKDATLRSKIGRQGRAFAKKNLDWKTNLSGFPDFYRRCLARIPSSVKTAPASDGIVPKLIAFYPASTADNSAGHVQAHPPVDSELYDFRLAEALDARAALAKRHGIYGFCFYYSLNKLLARPLEQFLKRDRPEFPFCICWANEQQDNSDELDRFINEVIPILKDPRYIKAKGAPVLLVYRPNPLPDARKTTEVWRHECRKAGIAQIHLAIVQSSGISDPEPLGFDAAIEFPLDTDRFLSDPKTAGRTDRAFQGSFGDYNWAVADQLAQPIPEYTWYRSVMPSWDKTPCRKNGTHVAKNSALECYKNWLRHITSQMMSLSAVQEPLLFVNAWKEWAEGTFLDPDSLFGQEVLKATRAGLCLGMGDYLETIGIEVDQSVIEDVMMDGRVGDVRLDTEQDAAATRRISGWSSDAQL